MPIEQKKLEGLLENKFPNSKIVIEDLAGDNDHYSVEIESDMFNGLSRIQQHQLAVSYTHLTLPTMLMV